MIVCSCVSRTYGTYLLVCSFMLYLFIFVICYFFVTSYFITHNSYLIMRPSFDSIFMKLAGDLAQRSHCIKAQVGAVLVKDTRIISIGYNGPPSGTHNCDEEWPEQGCPRDSKGSCSLALHAEENAILFAAKNGSTLEGATLYTTLSPCISCARLIFSSGIKNVYFQRSYAEYKGLPSDEGVDFLKKFGVNVLKFD